MMKARSARVHIHTTALAADLGSDGNFKVRTPYECARHSKPQFGPAPQR